MSGEWIEWKGLGGCPVDANAVVDVKWVDGEQFDATQACIWAWGIDVEAHLTKGGNGMGIIGAYRISDPDQAAPPSA